MATRRARCALTILGTLAVLVRSAAPAAAGCTDPADAGTVKRSLSQLLSCWATHDLAHIEQITRSLVRHRAPDIGPWRKYYSLLSER